MSIFHKGLQVEDETQFKCWIGASNKSKQNSSYHAIMLFSDYGMLIHMTHAQYLNEEFKHQLQVCILVCELVAHSL